MARVSGTDPFAQAVTALRAHMNRCAKCKYILHDITAECRCMEGMRRAAQVVKTCDALFKAKRNADSTINDYVYACPDISMHGVDYALTAQPLSVNAAQEGLF